MGSCTRRHFVLYTCFLQMITIIERQVFDFLGYMWAPIFVNFFHILFIIFGFYGAYHFRIKYIITYLIWNFLWIGWNSFLICFYLNIGTLDRDSDLLNLGTGSVSWFEVNGYGCKPVYNATNITSDDPFRPLRPDRVDDCLLTYDLVEVAQSGVQCLLSFFGILGAILISYIFLDEDDRFDFMNGDAKSPQHTVVHPMYVSYTSIPTSASATMLSNKHNANSYHNNSHYNAHSLSNSNQLHLSNSNHAMHSITTTPNATATKKSQQQQHQQQQQQQQQQQHSSSLILLHNNTKNLFSNNTSSTTNNSNGNSQSHSNSNIKNHSYSNSNSNNNNSNSNSNTFLIHTHTKNNSNNNNGSNFINNSNHNSNFGGGGGGSSSNGHHHQLQQPPAPHSRQGSFNGSFSSSHNQYQFNPPPASASASQQRKKLSLQSSSYNSRSNTPNASRNSTLTHMLYSPKQIRKFGSSSSNSIFPANTSTAIDFAAQKPAINGYYDDSTAKADHQLYVNGSRRHIMATTPTQDTTPSLSYASLDNSNQVRVSGGVGGGGATTASLGSGMASPLSNSNYSLTNSINNNMPASASSHSGGGGGHFARIHSKPKPAKSSSYSSFAHATNTASSNGSNMQRPEHNRMSNNFDETFEDDTFSLQNFKTDEGVTYVPFGKPTPGSYYPRGGENNNPSYASINSSFALEENSLNNNNNGSSSISIHQLRTSPNNNTHVSATAAVTTPTLPPAPPTEFCNDNAGILLENGAVLHPIINPAQRIMHQQNGLPFHPAYSPMAYRPGSTCSAQVGPVRPTNIPLPTVPDYEHSTELISPSAVTPPPPPQPRPHIFQPRTGCAPYPDLSPEVTERYAMPTQYIPRSPVASRIARRQRLQQQQQELQSRNVAAANGERSHLPIPSANFVDQIRDCPPGYGSGGRNSFKISRTKSHDRLSSSQNSSFREKEQQRQAQRDNAMAVTSVNKELMAPHVNRRSERKDAVKVRPRSYCNSITNGDGVIRTNIAADRELSEGIAYVA